MNNVNGSPFGGRNRTAVLLALALVEESYPRELSRLLETSVSSVFQALRSLEKDGLIAARRLGRTRAFRLNPRYFAGNELKSFLLRLGEPEKGLRQKIAGLRRRPRRSGKRL
jgi:DNA-binding transcriptional ArsR family regulator